MHLSPGHPSLQFVDRFCGFVIELATTCLEHTNGDVNWWESCGGLALIVGEVSTGLCQPQKSVKKCMRWKFLRTKKKNAAKLEPMLVMFMFPHRYLLLTDAHFQPQTNKNNLPSAYSRTKDRKIWFSEVGILSVLMEGPSVCQRLTGKKKLYI